MSTESSSTRTWSAKKKWIAGAGIIIALLCILTIASKFYVEEEIEAQLKLVGKRLTGRRLTLDSVTYHPLTWETVIENVEIPNPEGYSSRNPAVSLERIRIVIAPWAVLQKLVHIRSLQIDGVTLYPEVKKIPFSFDALVDMIMNPEINLIDIERMGWYTPGKRKKTDKPLWYLRIDDFSVTSVQIQFTNLTKLKDRIPFLPKYISAWMPDTLDLKDYQQLDLGADGKHTGAMIAQEVLNRHIEEVKEWYETKKTEIKEWLEAQKGKMKGLLKRKQENKTIPKETVP